MYKFDGETEKVIARRYESGERPSTLAKEYGCAQWTIRAIAKRQGVTINPRGNQYREFPDAEVAEMYRRWEAGESQNAIALSLGVNQVIVSRVLRRGGYHKETRLARGERSNLWKGGKTISGGGYVMVHVSADHPFASMRTRVGYIMEHRLIMAESFGRPLERHETVHHKNGNRADNRLENLEVRIGLHGRGARFRCRCCGSYDVEAIDLHTSED